MALMSKNKLEFADGTIEKPNPIDARFNSWQICNNIVLSWIIKSLTSSIAQMSLGFDSAKKL